MTALHSKLFVDVAVGHQIPPMAFHFSLEALVRYAAATWDFHPYHYDVEFVRKLGMPAPVADGQMLGALMARLIMCWGGGEAFLRSLSYRQRVPVFVGDAVSISGAVVSSTMGNGVGLVGVHLTIVKADGTAVLSDATATIELICGRAMLARSEPSEGL